MHSPVWRTTTWVKDFQSENERTQFRESIDSISSRQPFQEC